MSSCFSPSILSEGIVVISTTQEKGLLSSLLHRRRDCCHLCYTGEGIVVISVTQEKGLLSSLLHRRRD
jgi:hypothetical protein